MDSIFSMGKDFIANATEKTKEYYEEGKKTIQQQFKDNPFGHGSTTAKTMEDYLGGGSGLPAGTPHKIRISGRTIKLTRLIDEGGFSYVLEGRDAENNTYAIKRLCIQDSEMERAALKEIAVMKKLQNKYCIKLHGEAILMEGGQKTIYLLMEKADSSLIDLLRARAEQNRPIPEQKLLSIFHTIALAVESMHRMKPPIQHRDLKIENVLRVGKSYKLCDFGSTTTTVYHLNTKANRQAAETDIQKNTTMAYRSPEMCDLFTDYEINEKSDVWALGCVLYKLAFFKGPFEEAAAEGSFLSIINCKYKIPTNHSYSQQFIKFIKTMLTVNVQTRPDIWKVIETVCKLRNVNQQTTRPNHVDTPQSPSSVPQQPLKTQKKNTTKTRARPKKHDLFDLLGEDTEQNNTKKTKAKAKNLKKKSQIQHQKKQANQFGDDWADDGFGADPFGEGDQDEWGFDDTKSSSTTSSQKQQKPPIIQTNKNEEEWGDFDEDAWNQASSPANSAKKSTSPTISSKSSSSQKQQGSSFFDELQWESSDPVKQSTQKSNTTNTSSQLLDVGSPTLAHTRSKSNNALFDMDSFLTTPSTTNTTNGSNMIDFEAHEKSRKALKNNILDMMDGQSMNRHHSYDSLNRLHNTPSPIHTSPIFQGYNPFNNGPQYPPQQYQQQQPQMSGHSLQQMPPTSSPHQQQYQQQRYQQQQMGGRPSHQHARSASYGYYQQQPPRS